MKLTPSQVVFSKRLRKFRVRAKLTQVQLADLSGVGNDQISDVELGRTNASLSTLDRLAKALRIDQWRFLK